MHRLQTQWRDFVAEYSGAMFEHEEENEASAPKSQIRPDTPELNAISVKDMEAWRLETVRQESILTHMQELAAEELTQSMHCGASNLDASC
ncbi:hypothetical protein BN14_12011 [Rhizoctonia solani AG-1 IB]|uniref:Uncharacterized protein n=1 Tax=Thanatephorus cucumeris (strain AG1-IB / isolate 7/3/14) TaxID=1108050 RepID=M5CEI2_THACB|nr:hypothetical protein BN14_12011 [Rhizoctonia solani AG-1 IB]